jgi:hypothetical protein
MSTTSTTTHRIGRVDVHRGQHVLTTYIGDKPVLTRHRGRDWTIAEGATLGDIITAAVALLEFENQRDSAAA